MEVQSHVWREASARALQRVGLSLACVQWFRQYTIHLVMASDAAIPPYRLRAV